MIFFDFWGGRWVDGGLCGGGGQGKVLSRQWCEGGANFLQEHYEYKKLKKKVKKNIQEMIH